MSYNKSKNFGVKFRLYFRVIVKPEYVKPDYDKLAIILNTKK